MVLEEFDLLLERLCYVLVLMLEFSSTFGHIFLLSDHLVDVGLHSLLKSLCSLVMDVCRCVNYVRRDQFV